MDYLPIFIDVRARACLVVGAGSVATRKVELLLQAGALVQVVAPRSCEALSALAGAASSVDGGASSGTAPALRGGASSGTAPALRGGASLQFDEREYESRDLDGKCVVIAATDRVEINARVAADARARAIPVNVVDSPALCTFIMPAIVDRSPVLVAVSTAGASPVLARLTRARIEAALPQRLGKLAEFAARYRATIQARFVQPAERREFWQRVLAGEVGELVLAGHESEASDALEGELAGRREARVAQVTLVAAGVGDVERLSLRALRALGDADVVMHETDALPVVLTLGRRDAERVDLGALGGAHGWSWRELADAVAARCARAERVCVVRCLDPYADPDASDALALRGLGLRLEILRPAP